MAQYVIFHKGIRMYMGQLSSNGKNSQVSCDPKKALKFGSVEEAQAHINLCVKNDAGITSSRNVQIYSL